MDSNSLDIERWGISARSFLIKIIYEPLFFSFRIFLRRSLTRRLFLFLMTAFFETFFEATTAHLKPVPGKKTNENRGLFEFFPFFKISSKSAFLIRWFFENTKSKQLAFFFLFVGVELRPFFRSLSSALQEIHGSLLAFFSLVGMFVT